MATGRNKRGIAAIVAVAVIVGTSSRAATTDTKSVEAAAHGAYVAAIIRRLSDPMGEDVDQLYGQRRLGV
jgi:hypothetical protein